MNKAIELSKIADRVTRLQSITRAQASISSTVFHISSWTIPLNASISSTIIRISIMNYSFLRYDIISSFAFEFLSIFLRYIIEGRGGNELSKTSKLC